MPARSNITINDGETTPVAHTFVPRTGPAGSALPFVEPGNSPIGDKILTIASRMATRRRVVKKLTCPVVSTETINGVSRPTLERAAFSTHEYSFDKNSTKQERKNQRLLDANWLLSAQAIAMIDDMEDYW